MSGCFSLGRQCQWPSQRCRVLLYTTRLLNGIEPHHLAAWVVCLLLFFVAVVAAAVCVSDGFSGIGCLFGFLIPPQSTTRL